MAHLLEEVPSNFPLRAAPGRFIYIMGDEDIPYVDEMLKDMCVMDYVHWSPYVDPQNRPEPWYNVQFKDFILSHVPNMKLWCSRHDIDYTGHDDTQQKLEEFVVDKWEGEYPAWHADATNPNIRRRSWLGGLDEWEYNPVDPPVSGEHYLANQRCDFCLQQFAHWKGENPISNCDKLTRAQKVVCGACEWNCPHCLHEEDNLFCIMKRLDDGDGDGPTDAATNRRKRSQCYAAYIRFRCGVLRKGHRKMPPGCFLCRVRDTFPDPEDDYTGYQQRPGNA